MQQCIQLMNIKWNVKQQSSPLHNLMMIGMFNFRDLNRTLPLALDQLPTQHTCISAQLSPQEEVESHLLDTASTTSLCLLLRVVRHPVYGMSNASMISLVLESKQFNQALIYHVYLKSNSQGNKWL